MKEREEKFTRRGTPDKHTSNIFLCISCSESCAQPLHVKSSLIINKQLSQGREGCTKAQAGFHPIHLNFSPVFLVATACTTEEDDVQARECQRKEELLEVTPFSSIKLDLQKICPISIEGVYVYTLFSVCLQCLFHRVRSCG